MQSPGRRSALSHLTGGIVSPNPGVAVHLWKGSPAAPDRVACPCERCGRVIRKGWVHTAVESLSNCQRVREPDRRC